MKRYFLQEDAVKYGAEIAILVNEIKELKPIKDSGEARVTIPLLKEFLPFFSAEKIKKLLLTSFKEGAIGGYKLDSYTYYISRCRQFNDGGQVIGMIEELGE